MWPEGQPVAGADRPQRTDLHPELDQDQFSRIHSRHFAAQPRLPAQNSKLCRGQQSRAARPQRSECLTLSEGCAHHLGVLALRQRGVDELLDDRLAVLVAVIEHHRVDVAVLALDEVARLEKLPKSVKQL